VVGSSADERHPVERLLGTQGHQQGVITDYISNRLSGAIQELAEDRPPFYETVEEFKKDLYTIKDSLLENKAESLLTGEFAELLEAVEVFGFFLASIDMRQDSSVHEACVAELLASAGINDHYS
ncbi:phosphoenolpyruvate carboxylase, partial [Streptococcus pneumoniae]|nr:phosphoenolpyruvate carboxylase [Streptococcus pneumoniae]